MPSPELLATSPKAPAADPDADELAADVARSRQDPVRPPSPKQLRAAELDACTRELTALLDRYDAQLTPELVMGLGENGGARYRWLIHVNPK